MSYLTTYVSVHPGMYSGEPCIKGHRIPTRMIADLVYEAVEPVEWITHNYDITRDDVMVACWFEARHGRSRKLRRYWKAWLAEADGALWTSEGWDKVPFPPAVREAVPA